MADDLIVSTSAGGPNSSVPTGTRFSLEEITTLNGAAVTAALAQRIILAIRSADSTALDVTVAQPLPVSLAALAPDAATQTTLAAILAKLIAAPATEATLQLIEASIDAVFGAVDGLEGKDFATQTTLAAILAKIIAAPATEATLAAVLAKIIAGPATELKQDDIITLLTAQAQLLDGLETQTGVVTEAAPATDTASSGLNGRLQRIAQRLTSLIALIPAALGAGGGLKVDGSGTALPVSLAASELHIGEVGGKTADVAVTVTRPADTTAYAANDSVNTSTSAPTIITFAAASRVASGTGYITKARLSTSQSANVAQFRLYLFSVAAPFLSNDNAAFLIKAADNATRLGYIDFPAMATEAGSDVAITLRDDIRFGYVADSGSALYGILLTKTAFTPASAQTFHLVLTLEQN